MKKSVKKFISLLGAFTLVVQVLPISSFAQTIDDVELKSQKNTFLEGYKSLDLTPAKLDKNYDINAESKSTTGESTDKEILEKFIEAKLKYYKLRPDFDKDKNIVEFFNKEIKDMEGEGITATLQKTDDESSINKEGVITYYDNFDFSGWSTVYSKLVKLKFKLKLGSETTTYNATAIIGWNKDHMKENMQQEIDQVTNDRIKGENTDIQNIESDLTLPQIMGSSYKTSLSQISWTSSNEDVISIKEGEGFFYPDYIGEVTKPQTDTQVTLTATFKCNKTNEDLDGDIILTKDFIVNVKGQEEDNIENIKREMLDELNEKYTTDKLKDLVTEQQLDLDNVVNDIHLPIPSRIGLVNKEIKVTSSDENLLKINGYRTYTYQPMDEDKTVNLIITMTRENISVQKIIPLTIKVISQEEIDKEIELMDSVKQHYFDGINNNQNIDKDNIVNNLKSFLEVSFKEDGKTLDWIYNINDEKGIGISPTDINPDDVMGTSGYRLYQSSNNSIIKHENLLVYRPERDTQVTIKSILSSKKFGKYIKLYPDNEDFQKLYRQEVSTTVTVKGTKENVQITFDSDNDDENIVKDVDLDQALNYTPNIPQKEGYIFVGWYEDIDDISTEYKEGKTYSKDTTYKAKYARISMVDAQAVSKANDTYAIKFKTQIYTNDDDIVEMGTIILPENLLEEGTHLGLSTPKIAKSICKVLLSEDKEQHCNTYLGTLINIPKSQYNRKMIASAYAVYKDKSGNKYTVLAPYKSSVSVGDLYK